MKQLQLRDFLGYRFLSGLRYAPGGQRAAFVVSQCDEEENCYQSRLWMWDGELRQLTDIGKEKLFLWLDDHRILFPAVRTAAEKKRAESKDRFTSFYALDLRGGEAVHAFTLPIPVEEIRLIDEGVFAAAATIDALVPDYADMTEEARAQVERNREEDRDYEVLDEAPFYLNGSGFINKQRTALYLVDVREGVQLSRLSEEMGSVRSWCVQGDTIIWDEAVYADVLPSRGCRLKKYDPAAGEMKELASDPELTISGLYPAEGCLYALGTRQARYGENENDWCWLLDADSGCFRLIREEEYSMYGCVGSDCRYGGGNQRVPCGSELYHITTREGNAWIHVLSGDGQDRPFLTKEGSADCFDVCAENDAVLVIGLYDGRLQELYAVSKKTGAVRRISHFNDAVLSGKYIADPIPLSVKSAGLDIGGWVLLPKDYDPAKTYPAVLDIHGGPKTVYGPVFCHEMQVWANLGYFVLFCNPKGSDGRRNDFADIRGEYGETDYQNLMDFTDAVLRQYPQIDPKRLCETGGSYGGFMTNWIIGHTDRFCCTASQRSISNWISFYGVSDIGWTFTVDQIAADPFTDPKKLWDHSPLKYAGNAVTPTLFIHSDEDYRCPLNEGMQMFTALRVRGVPSRLCLFHGETHELSRSGKPKHRVRRLEEITNWFEKYAKI